MSYLITSTLTIGTDSPLVKVTGDLSSTTAAVRELASRTAQLTDNGWIITGVRLMSRTLTLRGARGRIATLTMDVTRAASPVTPGTGRVPTMEDAARSLLHGTPLPA